MIPRTGVENTDLTQRGLAPRVALVHEWLVHPAGSEAILAELKGMFPGAVVHCLLDRLTPDARAALGVGRTVQSPLGALPRIGDWYRWALPLMPWAVEWLDVSAYDIVISVSHAVAKSVRTHPGQFHATICCTPMRYAWDLEEDYLGRTPVRRALARPLLARLRAWDRATASRSDAVFAISRFVEERIERCWGRASDAVLYPPVDTEFFQPEATREGHYVTASRCVPYKRLDTIIEAFRALPDRRLEVLGGGPEFERLQRAAPPNVRMMGHASRELLRERVSRARAFVFAATEDFGIAPVEALACGVPVIAYGRGGACETVGDEGGTRVGLLYSSRTAEGIAAAVREFESDVEPGISASDCRARAEQFSRAVFRERVESLLQRTRALAKKRRDPADGRVSSLVQE